MTIPRIGMRNTVPASCLAVAAIFLLLLTSCSRSGPEPVAGAAPAASGRGAAGVPVLTAFVAEKAMPVNVHAVGTVEPASSVAVRAQVTGALMSVAFTEGQNVTAGQVLFQLDPRPFDAALKQAEAALARDTAQAQSAEAQRVRYSNLLKGGLVSPADYDVQATQAASLAATVTADAAAVENAKLQRQYRHHRGACLRADRRPVGASGVVGADR